MFGDDFFGEGIEDLFNQLAGRSRGTISKKNTPILLNTVEDNKKTYLVFDVSGKSNVVVDVVKEKKVDEYGDPISTGEKALEIRNQDGTRLNYTLPKELRKKKMDYSIKNGILEVVFKK